MPVVAAAAFVVGMWELLSATHVIAFYLLPGPWRILRAMGEQRSLLWSNAGTTLAETVKGFAAGNGVAFALAVIFSWMPRVERALFPLLVLIRATPLIALIPAFVIWLGVGPAPVIVVTALAAFIPTLINTLKGLQSVDADADELVHTLHASRWQRFRVVQLPTCLPFLFAALKIAVCACFITAVVVQWINASAGLGTLMLEFGSAYRLPEMWACIMTLAVLALASYAVVAAAERVLAPWARTMDVGTQ